MKIAILDDDQIQLELIKKTLCSEGVMWVERPECSFFERGFALLETIKKESFDVFILDRRVPDMSGDVILQWLRQYNIERHGVYPIVLMLSSLNSREDEVYALQVGADDYLTKPFSSDKLFLKINRLLELRRWQSMQEAPKAIGGAYAHSKFSLGLSALLGQVDELNKTITLRNNRVVKLSGIEFHLALIFFKNPSVLMTRRQIVDGLLEHKDISDRRLDFYIHTLRAKFGFTINDGIVLRTVYGLGYRLDVL